MPFWKASQSLLPKVGNAREKIEALGEEKKIIVVANAIAVRKGGKELRW